MKRKKINSKTEEKIITAMIVSDEFLSRIVSNLDMELFSADHFKKIAKWCKKYHIKYHKAPKENIETIYHSWVEKGIAKEETVDAVHDILEKLSDTYEEENLNNIPYLIDQASEHFQMKNYERLRDNLENALLNNDMGTAESVLNTHRSVKLGINVGIDIFNDEEAWRDAYSDSQKPLFTMGNEKINSFFGSVLCRDNLLGILAPEKRGKSFWCDEFVFRALRARRKVARFDVGDMSQNQTLKRLGSKFSKRPIFKKDLGNIKIPVKIRKVLDDIKIKYKMETHEHIASEKSTAIARKRFLRQCGISNQKIYLKTSNHPNSSLSVSEIFDILSTWEIEDNFVPDVIIIDYADILASEPGSQGDATRDKINETWKALRRLSQEKHCLVIVPTQADAASYDQNTLSASNFSEDKRKLAHVTGMLGLNQTDEEKDRGIMRLNWILLRESAFSTKSHLYIGQCLTLGKTFCCGFLK